MTVNRTSLCVIFLSVTNQTIGLVTGVIPFSVTSLGQTFLITTVVGKFFQIYDANTLHLLFVSSPETSSPITAIYSHFHHVFASWGRSVGIFKRGALVSTIVLPLSESDSSHVRDLLVFGQHLCIATEKTVYVYQLDIKSPAETKLYTSYSVPNIYGEISRLCHLPTYLNKIVLCTARSMLLFNVRTSKLIFASEEFDSPIVAVEPSPVLDTVAVATEEGLIHIYNIKQIRTLFSLSVGERISSLSFRTDGTPFLGVGTRSGDLFFYDLNTKKRAHTIRNAHSETTGGVTKLSFLNGQSIVVSCGADNLLQEFVFDPAITTTANPKSSIAISTPPRILRSRGGHSQPPSFIIFTDEEAHFILSASQDQSLWNFSLRKDSQNYEFSQRVSATANGKRVAGATGKKKHSLQDKFPEITAIDYQMNKQNQWDNILTAHKNQTFARTWSASRGIVGSHMLQTIDGGLVKSVSISGCGNFGIVGSSNGSVAVYNLQSGILRKRFPRIHTQAVTGVSIDSLNTVLVTCSLDGTMAFTNFQTGELTKRLELGSSAISLKLHRKCNLAAVSLDDLSIHVIDVTTRNCVRQLYGHSNAITSFDFSPDGRWIVSASLDHTLRTWDLPSSGCIDAVKVASSITCVQLSPNGEWLATSHVQGIGIQLWTLKSQFQKVSTRHINDDEIQTLNMPNVAGEGGATILEGAFGKEENDDEDSVRDFTSVTQLSKDLLTLSLLPKSKLNILSNLETIRERNKPNVPPKSPEKAPFFLGQMLEKSEKQEDKPEKHFCVKLASQASGDSPFTAFLRERDFDRFIDHLKGLSPSLTDLEIRSLQSYEPFTEMISFIDAITHHLKKKQDYELLQAWMSMFLKVHGDVLLQNKENTEIAHSLVAWANEEQGLFTKIDVLVKYCSGVINYIRTG